jgi:hypothetical protein
MIVDQGPCLPKRSEVVMFCCVNWLLLEPSLGRMKVAMNALKHIRPYLVELQFAHHLAVPAGAYCMRNFWIAFIAGTLVLIGSISRAHSQDTSGPTSAAASGTGSHDFDFLVGAWRVHHHRLKPNSQEWVDFEGTCSNRRLMDGGANMEEHALDAPYGAYRAIAVRAYDSKTEQWAIWWLDRRYPSGPVDPPVKGRFENGIGTFYGDYTQDGKPRTRFLWSNITPTSARWEQASSSDGGKTWDPNWTMSFERDTSANTHAAAATSDSSDFDFLRGEWRIHHRYLRVQGNDREWVDADGIASNRALMRGRANIEEHAINAPSGAYRAVALRSYDPKTSQWSIWWLDGRSPHGQLDPPVQGRFEKGIGTFYGHTTINGKPMRVRFVWSQITATSAHWEQAYSPDTGNTWETNWTMEFRRTL